MARISPKAVGAVGSVAAAIIAGVFAVEGGFVDHPDDPGGATQYGVTEKVARQHGYTGDMRMLPQETAFGIFYADYIVKPGFAPLIEIAPAVVEELVDTAVNTGPDRPSRWFQASLNAFSQRGAAYPTITVDGKVGPATINAYRGLQKARGPVQACELMLKALDAQQGQYYLALSLSNPRFQTFTAGWLAKRIGNVPLSRCGG